jgi:hypothetical protein
MARFDNAEHALMRASLLVLLFLLESDGDVRVMTATKASIMPGVRKTRCLLDLLMLKFMRARQALVVHEVAPDSMLQEASATCPKASTNPGVPKSAASLASALLKFFTHVVALRRASSRVLTDEEEKWAPTMTSLMASNTSGILAISILFAFPQLRFMTAMQA